jgi:hypothetical protein
MTKFMKESWIDLLSSFCQSSYWGTDGVKKLCITFSTDTADEFGPHFPMYRRLVRDVGYSIHKILITRNKCVRFLTTIPYDKYETIKEGLFAEWQDDVIEFAVEDDCSCDESSDEETITDAEDNPN